MATRTFHSVPYRVDTFRKAGLEARWTKNRKGQPVIVCRWNSPDALDHQRERWWLVDSGMTRNMETEGVLEGFRLSTILGCYFSAPI